MSTRKKTSKRTATTSSRTRSVEPAIDGLGGTSPSLKQEWREGNTVVLDVAAGTYQIKKRKQTTSIQSSIQAQVFKDGTFSQNGFSPETVGKSFVKTPVTQQRPEPRMSNEKSVGLKHDSEKPLLAYIPKAALDAEGKAFGYGARKYEAWNYRNGIAVSRTVSAALRHISQFLDGEDLDQESGAHHLGSARANLAMALDTLAHHPQLDDRFKGNK